jgi:hypothetical protein
VRPKRVAFRARNSVGTRGLAFAAQWLAYALPYRRFVDVLTDANARLGADVDRYSFIVVDLHHLLLAGLPAHFESYVPSHAVRSSPRDIRRLLETARYRGPPAMGFQSGMVLPTSLFEAFKHPLVGPLISPMARFVVSLPAVFLCGFPPGLTPRFLRNFTRNVIREVVVD